MQLVCSSPQGGNVGNPSVPLQLLLELVAVPLTAGAPEKGTAGRGHYSCNYTDKEI